MDLKPFRKGEPHHLLSLLVAAGIASVAYADHLVVSVSLALLYFRPLALSSFIHRLRTSLLLVLLCVVLSDQFGPPENAGWQHIVRNLLALIGSTTVVLFVNQLTEQRTTLASEVRAQTEELANEMRLPAEVQRRLLPQHPPSVPGFEIAAQMYPAKAVGGDFYDFMECKTENWDSSSQTSRVKVSPQDCSCLPCRSHCAQTSTTRAAWCK